MRSPGGFSDWRTRIELSRFAGGDLSLGLFDLDHRQGKAQPKLIAEINLDVMEAKLLELHPAEIMDVGGVAFHFLQVKIDFRLRDRLGVIRADDFRALMKPARAAAPARPDAKAQVVDREFRCRHNVEHPDKRLHAVEFAAYILAEHTALEVG